MKTQLVTGLKEATKENPIIEPNIFFVSISAEYVGQSAPSKILPLLNLIEEQWGLNINIPRHYKIAKRILINSVQNN